MTTLTVKIETLDETMSQVAGSIRAVEAGATVDEVATLSFPSWELMHRVLTPKRLEILKAMVGQGAMSIRAVARRVGRDFKGVHTDVDTLLKSGVIDKSETGGIVFPYDRIHFEFDIQAAA